MKTRYPFIVLILAVAFALSVQTCLGVPRLMFNVPPVKFILCPDVNSDGHIDLRDTIAVSRSFGAASGGPRWNPRADINGDDRIDIFDLALIASMSRNTD